MGSKRAQRNQKNGNENVGRKKIKLGKLIIIIIVLFIIINLILLVCGKKNIFSLITEKNNSDESIADITEVTYDGVTVKLKDIGISDNMVIIEYNVKTETDFEYVGGYLDGTEILSSNGIEYDLISKDFDMYAVKVAENELEIYEMYTMNTQDFGEEIRLTSNLTEVVGISQYGEEGEEEEDGKTGEWNLSYTIKRNEHLLNLEEYTVNNSQIEFNLEDYYEEGSDENIITLNEIKLTDMGTIFNFETTYAELEYTFEITDEEGNILCEKGTQILDECIISERLDLSKQITITVYESYYSEEDDENKEVSNSMTIDLSSELSKKTKITLDGANKIDISFQDIKLNIPDSWTYEIDDGSEYIDEEETEDDVDYDMSYWSSYIAIEANVYENDLEDTTLYEIERIDLNDTLENAFEMASILNATCMAYESSGEYDIYLEDDEYYEETEEEESENSETYYTVTYDELKEIVSGGNVEKDGYTLSIEDLGSDAEGYEVISKESVSFNGIDAIKYISRGTYREMSVSYVFILNGYTYIVYFNYDIENEKIFEQITENIVINSNE